MSLTYVSSSKLNMIPTIQQTSVTLIIFSTLMACSPMPNPETATVVARPKTAPMKALTDFSEALSCMDNLFLARGADYTITSDGLPDQTGAIQAGTREMMITAISKMSIKSKGFTFVDYDQRADDVNALQNLIGGPQASKGKFLAPKFYIRGAISQFDRSALQDNFNAGLSYQYSGHAGYEGAPVEYTTRFPDGTLRTETVMEGGKSGSSVTGGGLGYNQQATSSIISMDVNIGDLVSRQILPGMSSNNSIILTTKSKEFDLGADIQASIQKVGLNFNKSLTRTEGIGTAVRTLIELSMIESLGKLAGVPYWKCLGQNSTHPDLLTKTRESYDDLSESERIKTIQSALVMAGYYKESITGIVDVATQDAISRYQADNNLIANGRIDFDLYHNMIVNKYIDGPIIPEDANNSIAKTNSSNRSNSIPVGTGIVINMSSNRGNAQSFSVGEMFQLTMSVSKSAFVYCYYQDTNGQVFRVFPNRFSPNAAIAAEQTIKVPPASLPFQLILDKPGNQERVDCIASRRELGINLPKDMLIDDLQPIPNRNIDNIIDEFRNLDEEIVYKTLRILVSN